MEDKVISGFHPVEEALLKGVPLHAIYVDKNRKDKRFSRLRRLARERGVKVLDVPEAKLNELSSASHQGIVALVSEISFLSLDELLGKIPKAEKPLIVVLDGVTDVGNVGAILRVVELSGAHGVILGERNSPYFGEAMVKASAGALWHVPVARVANIRNALKYLKSKGIWIASAVPRGGESVFSFDFNIPLAVVFGSEEKGIRKSILEESDFKITIPQRGKLDSLNVSVAAGIVLFVAAYRRGWLGEGSLP